MIIFNGKRWFFLKYPAIRWKWPFFTKDEGDWAVNYWFGPYCLTYRKQ